MNLHNTSSPTHVGSPRLNKRQMKVTPKSVWDTTGLTPLSMREVVEYDVVAGVVVIDGLDFTTLLPGA